MSKKSKNKKESKNHIKAYEYYVEAILNGHEDPIGYTAEKMDYSKGTIYNYSSEWKWADRIDKLMKEVKEETNRKLKNDLERALMSAKKGAIFQLKTIMHPSNFVMDDRGGARTKQALDILELFNKLGLMDVEESRQVIEVELSSDEKEYIESINESFSNMLKNESPISEFLHKDNTKSKKAINNNSDIEVVGETGEDNISENSSNKEPMEKDMEDNIEEEGEYYEIY